MEAKCAAAVFACALLAGMVTALALILAFREWGHQSGHSNGRLRFTGDEDREINVLDTTFNKFNHLVEAIIAHNLACCTHN